MSELTRIVSLLSHDTVDWQQVIADPAARPDGLIVTMVNPYAVCIGERQPGYLDMLGECDHVWADGILLARAASRALNREVPRRSFDNTSLAPVVFAAAAAVDAGVYLVGSEPGIAEQAARSFVSTYGVTVAGIRHGFFDDDSQREAFYDVLLDADPPVVICGMGLVHQERFLLGLRAAGWRGVGITCGGYLHQTADNGADYYPAWVDRAHLRAPYRLLREPRRMAQRYFVDYLPFFRQAASLALAGRGHLAAPDNA